MSEREGAAEHPASHRRLWWKKQDAHSRDEYPARGRQRRLKDLDRRPEREWRQLATESANL